MSSFDLERARRDAGVGPNDPWPPEAPLASLAERAQDENGDREDDVQEELFPLGSVAGDPKTTVEGIIPVGVKTEVTASLQAVEIPSRSGLLLNPAAEGKVQVTYRVAKVELVLKRDGDGLVQGAKIRQVLRPVYVEETPAASE